MKEITFDIETIPNTSMLDRLPKPKAATGNLKDPAKIAEKEAAARAEQIEKMALSPLYGRICCWVGADDTDKVYSDILTAEGRKTLAEYCVQDVLLTQRIFNRISGILI